MVKLVRGYRTTANDGSRSNRCTYTLNSSFTPQLSRIVAAQIFRRLQSQAKEQTSQLGLLQQQVESKDRESRKLRIVQAQVNEILNEDPKTVMYEGVGKMCGAQFGTLGV